MKTTMQIISSWIVALERGRVEIKGRKLSQQEIYEVAIPLLQTIASEIMTAKDTGAHQR